LIDKIETHNLLYMGFIKASIADPEHTLKLLRAVNSQAEVQLLKADLVAGPEHIQFAARNAIHSFKGKQRRSKSLAMELLLYISCQRQIAKAIRLLGVDSKDSRIAIVALSESRAALEELAHAAQSIVGGESDEDLIEIQSKQRLEKLQRNYGITDKAMEGAKLEGETNSSVLKRLIVERSAFLDIQD
jgi:tRNA threonylcarbamoyladenosine modification (KEOPS) complex Cgi121 subunit